MIEGVAWKGMKGEAQAFHNRDQFLEYFQDNWIEGNYPLHMWNMYSLMAPAPTTTLKGGTQRFLSWLVKLSKHLRGAGSSKLSKQLQK